MSGQATGWVLRHGPKDRAMRLVLLTIADAANRDGEHAHPGIAAMVEGSLYRRSHVLATIQRLVNDGWLVVDEVGKGRGNATVYSIPGIAEKVQPADSEDRSQQVKGSNPTPVRVQSGELALHTSTENNNAPLARDYGFDHFWKVYPAKNGKKLGKRKTLDLWAKLSLEERRSCFKAAGHYAESQRVADGYVRDPERFFKDDFWQEWIDGPGTVTDRPGPGDDGCVFVIQ